MRCAGSAPRRPALDAPVHREQGRGRPLGRSRGRGVRAIVASVRAGRGMCGHASRSEKERPVGSRVELLLYVDVPAFLSTSDCVTLLTVWWRRRCTLSKIRIACMIAALMAPTAAPPGMTRSVWPRPMRAWGAADHGRAGVRPYAPHATQVELLLFDQPAPPPTPDRAAAAGGDISARWHSGHDGTDQEGARNSYNYEAEPPDRRIDKVNLVDWRLLDGDNSLSPKGRPTGPSCSIRPET